MKVVKYINFKCRLDDYLNAVVKNRDVLIISRTNGKSVAIMELNEFYSILETLYLMSTFANCKRLEQSVSEMNAG